MAVAGIPEVIHDFNLYLSGNKLVGVTGEVAIPDFESLTETISGAGILGEIETVVAGRFGSMTQEIPFRVANADLFKMVDPTTPLELTLRGAIQYNIVANGAVDYVGMRVVFRGRTKKLAIGTVKQGGPMDSSIGLELTYVLIELDGETKVELDKINGVYKVNKIIEAQKNNPINIRLEHSQNFGTSLVAIVDGKIIPQKIISFRTVSGDIVNMMKKAAKYADEHAAKKELLKGIDVIG